MHRLFATQVARRVSRILGRVVDTPMPGVLLKPAIDLYALGLSVPMDQVDTPADGFKCFGDFFARKLKPGSRPICEDSDALVSPSDGNLMSFGEVGNLTEGQGPFFEIKGHSYNVGSLLGGEDALRYENGGYALIYLHPRDYHRVHVPADAKLIRVKRIPGARYPVNGWMDGLVEDLYGKNERVAFFFECPSGDEFAVVMVAAFGVSNIDSQYNPGKADSFDVCLERDYDPGEFLNKGDDLGTFRLGSTVVMVWSNDLVRLDDDLIAGPIEMGRRIGRMVPKT